VKKRMCIPKKNERVIFVESMKLSFSFFLHHYTLSQFWEKVHFFDPTLIEFLDYVSGFSQPLKKKGRKMRFEGKCLVDYVKKGVTQNILNYVYNYSIIQNLKFKI